MGQYNGQKSTTYPWGYFKDRAQRFGFIFDVCGLIVDRKDVSTDGVR